jgi:hypothetical protein
LLTNVRREGSDDGLDGERGTYLRHWVRRKRGTDGIDSLATKYLPEFAKVTGFVVPS